MRTLSLLLIICCVSGCASFDVQWLDVEPYVDKKTGKNVAGGVEMNSTGSMSAQFEASKVITTSNGDVATKEEYVVKRDNKLLKMPNLNFSAINMGGSVTPD